MFKAVPLLAADQILKEAVQDFAAVRIERKTIADQEVNAVTICNQQSWRDQAADVFLSLQDKSRLARSVSTCQMLGVAKVETS